MHFPWLGGGEGGRREGLGIWSFPPTQGSHPAASESYSLPSKMLSSLVRGGAAGRVEREKQVSAPTRGVVLSLLPPPARLRFLGPHPSTPLSTPQPPLVFLAPSEEGVRGREGEPVARLTWPSLRWGRRPRLPGRPQLRQDPRGPGPSGRALRSLSSSAPCGPGNSPGFWQRPRWHPDRPAGCLECRRPAWSRRSPGGWGGASLWGDRAEAPRGWGRRRVLGD